MDINIEKFLAATGHFVRAGFRTTKKPAAKFKGTILEKETVGLFTAGKNFANLKAVKEAIAAGERGEVQKLPFGEWVTFPFIIKHTKDNVETFYIRLYPDPKSRIAVKYFVNQQQVEKEVFVVDIYHFTVSPYHLGVTHLVLALRRRRFSGNNSDLRSLHVRI